MESKQTVKGISRILVAILKQQAKHVIGDEVVDELGDLVNESLGSKFDSYIQDRQEKLTKAEKKAVKLFIRQTKDPTLAEWMVSLPLDNIPEIQDAIASLPRRLNEHELENVLAAHIRKNWPRVSSEEIDTSVRLYLDCLRRALATIPELRLDIMAKSIFDIRDGLQELRADVHDLAARLPGNSHMHTAALELPPRAFHFLGRADELDGLIDAIRPGVVIAVCGPGGIGKTAFVSEAIWQMTQDGQSAASEFPDGVIFHSFYHQPSIEMAYEHIARSFGVDPKQTYEIAAQRALSNRCAILFLDGCEAVDNVERIFGLRGRCAIVLTTRKRMSGVSHRVDLIALDDSNSLALIKALAGQRANSLESCEKICRFVGNLPLAVWLVGNYLDEREINASDFAGRLDEKSLSALTLTDRQEKSIPWLLEKSFESISEDGRKIMAVAGRLAFYYFEENVIWNILLDHFVTSHLELGDTLGELVRFGILRREGSFYIVYHALIHRYAREQLPDPENILERLTSYYIVSSSTFFMRGEDASLLFRMSIPHILSILQQLREAQRWQDVLEICNPAYGSLSLQGYSTIIALVARYGYEAAKTLKHPGEEAFWLAITGQVVYAAGEVERAVELVNDAIRLAEEAHDPKTVAMILQNLGRIYREAGQAGLSTDQLQKALGIAEELDDQSLMALLLNDIGLNFHYQDKNDRAIEYYQKALELIKQHPNPQVEGNLLSNLGEAYRVKGQVDQAILLYQRGLEIDRMLGDRNGEMLDLQFLGNAYRDLGDPAQAVEYYEKSLSLARQVGDQYHISHVVEKLANIELIQGGVKASLTKYQEALDSARKAENRWAEGVVLGKMGVACLQHGELEESEKYLRDALQIAQEVKNLPEQVGLLNNIGAVLRKKGNYWESIPHLQEAISMARSTENDKVLNAALHNLGASLLQTRQFAVAREAYRSELGQVREAGNRIGEGICLGVLAEVSEAEGDYQEAKRFYQQAVEILLQRNEDSYKCSVLNQFGSLLHTLHEENLAIQILTESLEIAKRHENTEMIFSAITKLGKVWMELKKYDRAMEILKEGLMQARKAGRRSEELSFLVNLGAVHTAQDELDLAFSLYHQALTGAKEVGDRQVQNLALGSLGIIHGKRGEIEKAFAHLEQALSLAKVENDLAQQAQWLSRSGDIHMELGEFELAVEKYLDSADFYSQIDAEIDRAESLNHAGAALLHMGELQEAGSCFFTALEIADRYKQRSLEGLLRGRIGSIFVRYKDEQALQYGEQFLAQALEIAEQENDLYNQAAWQNNLGMVYLNRNDLTKARMYYHRAWAIVQDILPENDPLVQSILRNLEK